jgi:Tfp pilus assembly protein PilO
MTLSETKADLKKLVERLHDPFQLRLFLAAVAVVVGYAGIYVPLASRIEKTSQKLASQQKRKQLAADIEHLRAEVEVLNTRLPENTDTNEWVQYVLDGVRETPLKLNNLDSDAPQRVGPYEAIVLHLELQGAFGDLDAFLDWVESNQRLFRVDSARIAPPTSHSDQLLMQLTLLGLKGSG